MGATSAVAATQVATEEVDADVDNSNDSGHQEYDPADDEEFKALNDKEMDDEIDRIEAEMDELEAEDEEESEAETKTVKKPDDDKK